MAGKPANIVTYTQGVAVHHVAHVTPKDALVLSEIIHDVGWRRNEYGAVLASFIGRHPDAKEIDCRQVTEAGVVVATHFLSRNVALLLAYACMDPRPTDSFRESMRRIITGTAFENEIPYLALEGINRR